MWECKWCRAVHEGRAPIIRKKCPVCGQGDAVLRAGAALPRTPQNRNSPATVVSTRQLPPPNAIRVRIGWTDRVQGWDKGSGQLVPGQWFRFYFPSNFGRARGQAGLGLSVALTITTSAGLLRYHGRGNDALKQPPRITQKQIELQAAEQSHGWGYVQLAGATSADITITLVERAYAREKPELDAAPLIPWAFHYWSYSRHSGKPMAFLAKGDAENRYIGQSGGKKAWVPGYSPFEHFDRHFKLGDRAFAWESDPGHSHMIPKEIDSEAKAWEGHCNVGASAAILFEEPKAKAGFDAEELKLFLTEFASNYGASRRIWTLGGTASKDADADLSVQEAAPCDLRPPTQVKAKKNFKARHYSEMDITAGQVYEVRGIPVNGWYRSADKDGKKIPAGGVELNLAAWKQQREDTVASTRTKLGRYAATFHKAIRANLAMLGHPLLVDLRAGGGESERKKKKAEVWNQALFFYEATFKEHEDAREAYHQGEKRDAQDMLLTVQLWANADRWPTNEPAATMDKKRGLVITRQGWGRIVTYRLQFDDSGNIIEDDPCNDWVRCHMDYGNVAVEYFAPRCLDVLLPCHAEMNKQLNVERGEEIPMGNPEITMPRIQKLGAKFRQRYKQ